MIVSSICPYSATPDIYLLPFDLVALSSAVDGSPGSLDAEAQLVPGDTPWICWSRGGGLVDCFFFENHSNKTTPIINSMAIIMHIKYHLIIIINQPLSRIIHHQYT